MVSSEPLLECFNVLIQTKLYELAVALGGHLLSTCERFIVDVHQQRRFILKFLFVFDKVLGSEQSARLPPAQLEEVLGSLIKTLSKIVCLDFLKQCAAHQIKVIFMSAWNLAYEAKERGLL